MRRMGYDVMTGEELLKETETVALEQYLATFDELFGRSESRAHGRLAWLGSTAEKAARSTIAS